MQSKATTVEKYLAELPADRRAALEAVRKVIKKNLDKDFAEGMQYGMIGYHVPHRIYPDGYHCDPSQPLPFAGLASQKNYMSVYLMCVNDDGEQMTWFREAWAKTGKKLDMGKVCIRFRRLEDLALDLIGEAIKKTTARNFIAYYESVIKNPTSRKPATAAKKKAAAVKGAKKAKVGKTAKKTGAR